MVLELLPSVREASVPLSAPGRDKRKAHSHLPTRSCSIDVPRSSSGDAALLSVWPRRAELALGASLCSSAGPGAASASQRPRRPGLQGPSAAALAARPPRRSAEAPSVIGAHLRAIERPAPRASVWSGAARSAEQPPEEGAAAGHGAAGRAPVRPGVHGESAQAPPPALPALGLWRARVSVSVSAPTGPVQACARAACAWSSGQACTGPRCLLFLASFVSAPHLSGCSANADVPHSCRSKCPCILTPEQVSSGPRWSCRLREFGEMNLRLPRGPAGWAHSRSDWGSHGAAVSAFHASGHMFLMLCKKFDD